MVVDKPEKRKLTVNLTTRPQIVDAFYESARLAGLNKKQIWIGAGVGMLLFAEVSPFAGVS